MKYLKYILIGLIIIVPCIIAVLIYNDKITQNSPVYYRQGVEFYNEGDYANAYYNFGKINRISPLYPMALYKQAKSAQKTGDYKTAALKYEMYLKKVPDSPFYIKAKLNLGKCYFYLKQYDDAKICFEELKQRTKNTEMEEIYFLGVLEKNNDKMKSADYFREYLKTAFENNAFNKKYVLLSADELGNLNINLTNEDKLLIGTAYFKNGKYKEALEYFSKLPVNSCWDYLVLSNHYTGNKIIAKKLIETGLVQYSYLANDDNLREIYNVYSSYLTGSRLKNWNYIYNMVNNAPIKGEDYVMYKLASLEPKKEKSIILYDNIVKKYPQSRYSPESLWNIFWNKYKQKDYKAAQELALKHLDMFKKVKSTPRIIFWLAKTYINQNKHQEAHNCLSELVSKYPDNYYGLRAEFILNKKNDFWKTSYLNKIPVPKEEIEFPISVSQIDIKEIKLINTLFEMGDYELWQDADFSNPIVESWFELKKDKKASSIVLARDEIEEMEIKPLLMSAAYKLAYPRYWVDEINIAGNKLKLDPFLIIAVIKEESYFDEHAKSPTGAIGLMQIMPQTANYMILKLAYNTADIIDLEDPKTNLFIGINYLKYLSERFNNDLMVVAAYNGGEGYVNKWIKIYNTDDNDEFIEDIPFPETKNYVKKVFRTYHLYKKLYK